MALSLLTSVSLLEPAYSWSHLPITKAAAIKLFSTLRAFPELYQYVSAFSNKTFPRDEGFAGFDSHTTIGDDGIWTSFGTLTHSVYQGPTTKSCTERKN
jgi:hypothetical protein